MEAGDIEGFLFVLSSYNPPSLKMKPNWNFSILKSKVSLNLDSSLVKRIHDTSQKLVGGKVSVGGSVKQKKKKTDLGEISRTGKSYSFKFSSKPNIYLGKSFFLAIILRQALVTVPACLQVPGLEMNAAPLVFWEQSRLNKGCAMEDAQVPSLWDSLPAFSCSIFLMHSLVPRTSPSPRSERWVRGPSSFRDSTLLWASSAPTQPQQLRLLLLNRFLYLSIFHPVLHIWKKHDRNHKEQGLVAHVCKPWQLKCVNPAPGGEGKRSKEASLTIW